MKRDRLYPLSHAPLHFHFRQTPADFVVTEIPLYDFAGEGEHLVLTVRKKGLSTWEMLGVLADSLGVKKRDIGYAGLKDKQAMTLQNVSLPATFEPKLATFSHPAVKILSVTRHTNKLRIGHLKGNRFFIRLKKVSPTDAVKLDSLLKWVEAHGMPNYFGHQRFGREGDNFETAREVVEGKRKIRDRKRRDFLMSAYQSHLFNMWLSKRIEISRLFDALEPAELARLFVWGQETIRQIHATPHFFKLLPGEAMEHYPHGKLFTLSDLLEEGARFAEREVAPTGLLPGRKNRLSTGLAWEIEKEFLADIPAPGSRRYAWVWPTDIEGRYKKEEWHYELHFTLPKGSYATVLIEMLGNREFSAASQS